MEPTLSIIDDLLELSDKVQAEPGNPETGLQAARIKERLLDIKHAHEHLKNSMYLLNDSDRVQALLFAVSAGSMYEAAAAGLMANKMSNKVNTKPVSVDSFIAGMQVSNSICQWAIQYEGTGHPMGVNLVKVCQNRIKDAIQALKPNAEPTTIGSLVEEGRAALRQKTKDNGH
jgi:hypothetical protein